MDIMMPGEDYRKTNTALTLLTSVFILHLFSSLYSIITAALQYFGVISTSSMYGAASSGIPNMGVMCAVLSIACLLSIAVLVILIITGVNMIGSKTECNEVFEVALPAGILMIISGPLMIIPCLNIAQPVVFLIGTIMYLRKLVRPGSAILLYLGAAGLGVAFLVALGGAIAAFILFSPMLSFLVSVVAAVIQLVSYSLFLIATLNAKGNRASWHKVLPAMGIAPPQYPMAMGAPPPPGFGAYPQPPVYPAQPPAHPGLAPPKYR